jgi:hypothetical protein
MSPNNCWLVRINRAKRIVIAIRELYDNLPGSVQVFTELFFVSMLGLGALICLQWPIGVAEDGEYVSDLFIGTTSWIKEMAVLVSWAGGSARVLEQHRMIHAGCARLIRIVAGILLMVAVAINGAALLEPPVSRIRETWLSHTTPYRSAPIVTQLSGDNALFSP